MGGKMVSGRIKITKQLAAVFKNLSLPKEILTNIVGALNTTQQEKANFHN